MRGRIWWYNVVMVIMQLLSWWYGRGWQHMVDDSAQRITRVAHVFSVPILLRTLGAPWRRIVSQPGAGIDQQLRALGDNMVSRAIGFTVRILVLLTAGIMILLVMLLGSIIMVIWPLLPPLAVGLVVLGVMR